MDNHIYISQLSTSLFSYKLLIKIKKVDVKLNKTLKLKFISMFFNSVYPTRPAATVTNSIICPLFYLRKKLFKLSLVLFCYLVLWLAKLKTQYSNSYYLVVATTEIPKVGKRTSLDVHFSICKFQDRAINRQ